MKGGDANEPSLLCQMSKNLGNMGMAEYIKAQEEGKILARGLRGHPERRLFPGSKEKPPRKARIGKSGF